MIDPDFIKRCQGDEFQAIVKEHVTESKRKKDKWKVENPEKYLEAKRKYELTDKGYLACVKRYRNRRARLQACIEVMTNEELELVNQFYRNTPFGYEVDHIIPLCKGGSHKIENLQYLTPEENRKKACN